LKEVLKVSKVN